MFADCVHPHVDSSPQPTNTLGLPHLQQLVEDVAGDMDIALKNLVGDGAADLAEKWADNGKIRQKLENVRAYLTPTENVILDRLLGVQSTPPDESDVLGSAPLSRDVKDKDKEEPIMRYVDSEDESDGGYSEDERGKTAHLLFASLAGTEESEHAWWVSSPVSQKSDALVLNELEVREAGPTKNSSLTGSGPWEDRLTPVSSPVHPLRRKQPSPLQIRLTHKRRHHDGSTSPSCTPPHVRKRLFMGDRTLGSPIRLISPQEHPHTSPKISTVDKQFVGSVTSSSRPYQHDLHPSPLLEMNNYPSKQMALAPSGVKMIKWKSLNAGHPATHSPGSDENIASDKLSTLTRTSGAFRRRQSQSPQWHLPVLKSIPSSETKEDSRASNRRAQRSRFHAQRLSIAERLAQARPDLVASTYESKRAALLAREAKVQEKHRIRERGRQKKEMKARLEATGTLLSIGTVDDDDGGMDWERSRVLAEAVKADIANGQRPMLPLLICAESQ